MELGRWADSRKDGVLRCRMDLPWGEGNCDWPLHPSEMLLDESVYLGSVLHRADMQSRDLWLQSCQNDSYPFF